MTPRDGQHALSETMLRAFNSVPSEWTNIPFGPELRWTTVLALESRGYIHKRLKGRPRAKWQWRRA